MYVVYGLEDQRDHEVFYVGITDDVQVRYLQHLRCDGSNPAKDARVQEMRDAGYLPLMRTLQVVTDLESVKRRESYWIQHYHQLGAHLTNQIIPLHHEIVYVRSEYPPTNARLGPRMTPEEQRQYVVTLCSLGLSRSTILTQVRKYIPAELVNIIFDECVPTNTLSTPSQIDTSSLPSNQAERIIRKFLHEGMTAGQIVSSEFTNGKGEPLTSGDKFMQRNKEVQEVLRRYMNVEAS